MTTVADIDIPVMPIEKPKGKFCGCEYFEVDSETYSACVHGKQPYQRWDKFFNMTNERNAGIKNYVTRNSTKDFILKDSTSGAMVYLKRKMK